MNKLIIRAIGKIPETWQHQGVDMYVDRLKTMAKVGVIELPEGHKGADRPDVNKTKKVEAESLLKSLPEPHSLIVLDETGKSLTSPEFASKLQDWGFSGKPIVFVIGGSWGIDKTVLDQADFILSLGKMTLPHGLARIVLAEQLYRAAMINSGKTYHK
ncbi:MAG: 23S rRNA (pseudouridine(1915)-N(3))-methyltransferase RlmH [Patescibacteria group bacterium]